MGHKLDQQITRRLSKAKASHYIILNLQPLSDLERLDLEMCNLFGNFRAVKNPQCLECTNVGFVIFMASLAKDAKDTLNSLTLTLTHIMCQSSGLISVRTPQQSSN